MNDDQVDARVPRQRSPLEQAVARHPASRGPQAGAGGYGLRSVVISPVVTMPVYGDVDYRGSDGVIGYVDIPAAYALECSRCGALFRAGSPFGLSHTLGHRWEAWGRKVRGRIYSAATAVGDVFTGRRAS